MKEFEQFFHVPGLIACLTYNQIRPEDIYHRQNLKEIQGRKARNSFFLCLPDIFAVMHYVMK